MPDTVEIEKTLHYLRENDYHLAAAVTKRNKLETDLKALKARLMKTYALDFSAISAQEREALADPQMDKLNLRIAKATYREQLLRNQRQTALTAFEIWRSQNSLAKSEMKGYGASRR